MEIMPDFKSTDAGVIPSDWGVKTFKEICKVNQGLQVAIDKRSKYPKKTSKIYITIQYLNQKKIVEYIDDYSSSVCCSIDDILMTRTGNTGLVVTGVDGVFHNNFFKINFDRNLLNKNYLIYFLSLQSTKKIILDKAGSSTIPDLNHGDFYSIYLPIPALNEQLKISTFISNIDALIDLLDCLITKKRNLKQAVMQQLLTGQTRLPGFSGEWEVRRLGELLAYEQPTNYLVSSSEYSESFETPVLTAGKTFLLGFTNEINGIYRNVPAIIFDDFTTASKYVDFEFKAKSSAMKILKTKEPNANLEFIYQIMQTIDFKFSEHKRHWISEYQKIEIKYPDELERTAIASALADIQAEIVSLVDRRDKTAALKQGMMQELLTGRTRLL